MVPQGRATETTVSGLNRGGFIQMITAYDVEHHRTMGWIPAEAWRCRWRIEAERVAL
jgi:hypothetical protein